MATTQMPAMISSMQAFLQLCQCSRRKAQPNVSKRSAAPRGQSDSDIKVKSDKSQNVSDIGDLSTDDYSDESVPTDYSTDRSTTTFRTKKESNNKFYGIGPPPGLEPIATSAVGQHFPMQASQQQSMDAWMWTRQSEQASFSASMLARAQAHNCAGNGADFAALKNALDKLSPQEAAALRGMLEERSSSQPAMAPVRLPVAPGLQAASVQPPRKNMSNVANEINGALFAAAGAMRTADMHPYEMAYDPSALGYQFQQARFARPTGAMHNSGRPVAPRNSVKQTSSSSNHASTEGGDHESMSTFLKDLSMTDNSRVLMVRKIAKLGFDAPSILQAYFSAFGGVERVMASATKQSVKTSQRTRMRPATVGFVVFDRPEHVETVLKHGLIHVVSGEQVTVGRFQSHTIDDKD